MTKQASDKPAVRKGATKVANTIAKVFDTVASGGNVITQCVTSLKSVYRGAEVPTHEEQFIANQVARIRKWSDKSAVARKSEVRKIVRNYLKLDEAVDMYRKKSDTFTWHECMKLLTQLNKDQTTRQAVNACLTTAAPTKVPAPKQIANLLTRISNVETRSAKIIAFRKDLAKLCEKHGI